MPDRETAEHQRQKEFFKSNKDWLTSKRIIAKLRDDFLTSMFARTEQNILLWSRKNNCQHNTEFPDFLPSPSKKKKESEVTQSCPTLCDPMDCSLPHSYVYGIFRARVLEWVAISFSTGSSRPRDWTQVSCVVGRRFTVWATRGAQKK